MLDNGFQKHRIPYVNEFETSQTTTEHIEHTEPLQLVTEVISLNRLISSNV